jgi:hypothetical protein
MTPSPLQGGAGLVVFRRKRGSHWALAERADELGFDERSLGARAQVDPQRVADALESDIDLEANLSVAEAKRLLQVLDLDFLATFRVPCAFCRQEDPSLIERYEELRSLPRDVLLARRRDELALTPEGLLDKLGITAWFEKNADRPWAQDRMRLWSAIEDGPDSLDDLSLDQVRLLNRVLLLPMHLLVGVSCGTCQR